MLAVLGMAGRVLVAIVRGVARELWFWLAGYARLLRRYTLAAVSSTGWLAVTAWQAWWDAFAIVAGPVIVFGLWCRFGPVSFVRFVSDAVVAAPGRPVDPQTVADDHGHLRTVPPDRGHPGRSGDGDGATAASAPLARRSAGRRLPVVVGSDRRPGRDRRRPAAGDGRRPSDQDHPEQCGDGVFDRLDVR